MANRRLDTSEVVLELLINQLNLRASYEGLALDEVDPMTGLFKVNNAANGFKIVFDKEIPIELR